MSGQQRLVGEGGGGGRERRGEENEVERRGEWEEGRVEG